MSLKLVSGRGGRIRIGRELGRGGEGAVFEVADQSEVVAKIYHSPPDRDKADKLIAMASGGTERLRQISAWPVDTIHDGAGGAIRGFLMRRIARQKDIHFLYGPKTRLRDYPDATYRFLVHVASNVARAFAVVHEHNHVIGDVNQGGVCVSEHGTITLVDCDSFQVGAGQRVFSCDVGIPIYQPPEHQTVRTFRGLRRTSNHDAFGLAVLIFQTLFLARHPFAGAFQGDGDMPIELAIREFRFAYSRDALRRQMRQPPGSLGLGAVPVAVAELFERAFLEDGVPGRRPSALEWVTALDGLAADLQDCKKNPAHAHARGLPTCPLCELEGRTGVLLFLLPRQAALPAQTINLEDLWRDLVPLIGSARVPAGPQLNVPVVPPPDAVVRFARAKSRAAKVLWSGVTASVLLGVAWHPAAAAGAVVAPVIARLTRGPVPHEARDASAQLHATQEQLQRVVRQIERECSLSPLTKLDSQAEALYRGLKEFPARRSKRLAEMERSRHVNQQRRFLNQFDVEDCNVKGLGPGLFAALVSHGVETADDLTDDNLAGIAGFGPKRVSALLAWRRAIEAKFKFDPADPADVKDRSRVERELQIEYAKELSDLQRAAEQIRAHAVPLRTRLAALTAEVGQARRGLAIHQATSTALAVSAPNGLFMGLGVGVVGIYWLARACTSTSANHKPPETVAPSSLLTTAEEVPVAAVAPVGLCGAAAANPASIDEQRWSKYTCMTQDVAGARWSACLARPSYAPMSGQGCPSTDRCCPER